MVVVSSLRGWSQPRQYRWHDAFPSSNFPCIIMIAFNFVFVHHTCQWILTLFPHLVSGNLDDAAIPRHCTRAILGILGILICNLSNGFWWVSHVKQNSMRCLTISSLNPSRFTILIHGRSETHKLLICTPLRRVINCHMARTWWIDRVFRSARCPASASARP